MRSYCIISNNSRTVTARVNRKNIGRLISTVQYSGVKLMRCVVLVLLSEIKNFRLMSAYYPVEKIHCRDIDWLGRCAIASMYVRGTIGIRNSPIVDPVSNVVII